MSDRIAAARSAWVRVKHYLVLAYGAVGTMLDVGLMVLGSLLVGLSIAVLLAGFDLVAVSQELSTGATLISAVVLAVIGLFCLGVASEGPLGRGRRLVGFEYWEVGIGRVVASLAIGFAALALYGLVQDVIVGFPSPLQRGAEGIRAVGVAGTTVVPLIGVPLSVALSAAPAKYGWLHRMDVPLLYVVWALAAISVIT